MNRRIALSLRSAGLVKNKQIEALMLVFEPALSPTLALFFLTTADLPQPAKFSSGPISFMELSPFTQITAISMSNDLFNLRAL